MQTGAGAKTHKPAHLKDNSSLITGDFNNDRKFIFLSEEQKPVDYRAQSLSPQKTNGSLPHQNYHQHHAKQQNFYTNNGSPVKKFPWSPEPVMDDEITVCDVVQAKQFPAATFVTIGDNDSESYGNSLGNLSMSQSITTGMVNHLTQQFNQSGPTSLSELSTSSVSSMSPCVVSPNSTSLQNDVSQHFF